MNTQMANDLYFLAVLSHPTRNLTLLVRLQLFHMFEFCLQVWRALYIALEQFNENFGTPK